MAKAASTGEQDVGKELKDVVAVLRRRKVFFAISMDGKTPVIKTHIKKKPKTLRKEAKSSGGGPKGCSGEMALSGKVIQLHCVEDGVPELIAKNTTKYFRENGLQFRVEIMPGVIEEPEEDESGDAAEPSEGEQAHSAPTEAGQSAENQDTSEAAVEEAEDILEEPEAATGSIGAATGAEASTAAQAEPRAAPQAQAPGAAERTETQKVLLDGLRDVKGLLQAVKERGRPDDLSKMQKLGDLFKKAVKQNDEQVGQKVLVAMRQQAQQVEANAEATARRRRARTGELRRMRAGLQSILRELG